MTVLVERAPAKVNLTLEILGRRPDGFHELRSLVVFAIDAADSLSATPSAAPRLHLKGPFASRIVGENLVDSALMHLRQKAPWLSPFSITLDKYLPIASGLGGGSADAAAAIRLARRIDPTGTSAIDVRQLARSLGADVPVCLQSRAAMMSGLGATTEPVALPAGPALVLVNTLDDVLPDKTAQVFRGLSARPVAGEPPPPAVPALSDALSLVDFASASSNELERVALGIFPRIALVLGALTADPRCRLARLSGAGPTCFGLYDTIRDATQAAEKLRAAEPGWWIVASRIA